MIEKYLDNRLYTLYLFPFILGSLTVFSFQPFNLTIVNFIVLPLFFYLIIYINKKSKNLYRKKPHKKNLFIFGTVFGFGFFISGVHWITNSLTFDENFKILIPFGLFLIPLLLSLFFSLMVMIVSPFLSLNFVSIFLFSGSLAFSDYIRAKVLSGFPWNLWAYSNSWSIEIIQIIDQLGLFAFNLVTITIFMSPSILFLRMGMIKKGLFLISIFLFILAIFIYGSFTLNKNRTLINSIDNNINVKIISPNFELKYGLSDKEIEERLFKLIKYSEPNKDLKTLFIWPEGVFSGYSFRELAGLKKNFSKNFTNNHYILFGVNRYNLNQDGVYNALIIVNNNFEIIHEYRKQKLVPFGEFLPFEKTLNKLGLKKITEGHLSFLKGNSKDNLILGNLNFLPLICYEIIFTELVQNSSKDTNLIINISEDGWFGNSIGPHQHFAKAIFRAVEQNSYLLRSTNKGISAIINNKGEVIKKLSPKEAGNIELDVPLITSNKKIKNDLIFFILLFTYILSFIFYNKNNDKK